MRLLIDAARFAAGADGVPHWVEHMSVADLSTGTYSLPRGCVDTQEPHTEDEIYVVLRGHGSLATDSATVQVGPGAVVYVPAGEPHRFVDITADLVAFVVFAPAEGTRAAGS